jgi:hypothetical protein
MHVYVAVHHQRSPTRPTAGMHAHNAFSMCNKCWLFTYVGQWYKWFGSDTWVSYVCGLTTAHMYVVSPALTISSSNSLHLLVMSGVYSGFRDRMWHKGAQGNGRHGAGGKAPAGCERIQHACITNTHVQLWKSLHPGASSQIAQACSCLFFIASSLGFRPLHWSPSMPSLIFCTHACTDVINSAALRSSAWVWFSLSRSHSCFIAS